MGRVYETMPKPYRYVRHHIFNERLGKVKRLQERVGSCKEVKEDNYVWKRRGLNMNNFSTIKKMDEFELADCIYDVSEEYIRISASKDKCNNCKKSGEDCIGLISEWLEQDNDKKRSNQIFLAKVDDLIDEVEELAWTHKDDKLPDIREKINRLIKEHLKDREV